MACQKEDIAASAKMSAQFEEYAIRDVDSTQAIALKLAPLVHGRRVIASVSWHY